MPLDLSPCEVGLPRYQPTFDLSKKRFMPHKNIPTVRELVKAKQEERSEPINNEFLERMEDSLMRWKPPASSHRGTTMAIEGIHPYQLPTAAMKKSSKKAGLASTNDNSISIHNESVLDSFNQWWRTGKLNLLNKKENSEGGDNDDDGDDDFSFNFGQEDINAVSGYTETMVRTPYAVPITYPREATVADRESILLNEQAIYQQYYNNPVPADYLAVSHRSLHENDLHYQQQQQQQQQQQKFLTIYLNWIKTCFATCSDH